jgi:hypothetical protein
VSNGCRERWQKKLRADMVLAGFRKSRLESRRTCHKCPGSDTRSLPPKPTAGPEAGRVVGSSPEVSRMAE